MDIKSKEIISVTDANKNFSKACRLAELNGRVVIFKNNKPKYVMTDLDENPLFELSDDEKIDIASNRILKHYKKAYEELAKW